MFIYCVHLCIVNSVQIAVVHYGIVGDVVRVCNAANAALFSAG